MNLRFFVTITVMFIITLIIYKVLGYRNDDDEKIHKYKDIKPKLKSGDIILFSCKTHESLAENTKYFLRTRFVGSEYGHAGIIIKKAGVINVLECTYHDHCGYTYAKYLNGKKKGGVRLIPLDTLIKEYHKESDATFAIKFISKEIQPDIISKNINKYKDITFTTKMGFYLLGIVDVYLSHMLSLYLSQFFSKKHMMCTEFLHNFLYKCRVLKSYPSKIFWPPLITNGVFDKLQIIKYSRPHKFIP